MHDRVDVAHGARPEAAGAVGAAGRLQLPVQGGQPGARELGKLDVPDVWNDVQPDVLPVRGDGGRPLAQPVEPGRFPPVLLQSAASGAGAGTGDQIVYVPPRGDTGKGVRSAAVRLVAQSPCRMTGRWSTSWALADVSGKAGPRAWRVEQPACGSTPARTAPLWSLATFSPILLADHKCHDRGPLGGETGPEPDPSPAVERHAASSALIRFLDGEEATPVHPGRPLIRARAPGR